MNIKWYMNYIENEIAFSSNWIQWLYKWYLNNLLNSFLLKTSMNSWYSGEILLKSELNNDSWMIINMSYDIFENNIK